MKNVQIKSDQTKVLTKRAKSNKWQQWRQQQREMRKKASSQQQQQPQ